MFEKYYVFVIIVVPMLFNMVDATFAHAGGDGMKKTILVGASIGEGWQFQDLPSRIGLKGQQFLFYSHYGSDKSNVLQKVVLGTSPDTVILKLCAAYFRVFNGDTKKDRFDSFKANIGEWVAFLKNNDVEPMLATVVPITKELPFKYKVRHFIKKYILFRDIPDLDRGQTLEQINGFNEWLRNYANQHGLRVLDLEKAVRVSDEVRVLRFELSTDGLHLNSDGYKELDKLAVAVFTESRVNQ